MRVFTIRNLVLSGLIILSLGILIKNLVLSRLFIPSLSPSLGILQGENTEREIAMNTVLAPAGVDVPLAKTFSPRVILEGKAAWYWPTSSKFRGIYGTTGMYTLELDLQAREDLFVFLSANFLSKNGHSLCSSSHYGTEIWFLPIELGLKYFPRFCTRGVDWGIYGALGAAGSYVHIHDKDPYIHETVTGSAWGFNTKLGSAVWLTRHLTMEIFGEYTYLEFFPNTGKNINIGGLSIGGGLGYSF